MIQNARFIFWSSLLLFVTFLSGPFFFPESLNALINIYPVRFFLLPAFVSSVCLCALIIIQIIHIPKVQRAILYFSRMVFVFISPFVASYYFGNPSIKSFIASKQKIDVQFVQVNEPSAGVIIIGVITIFLFAVLYAGYNIVDRITPARK